MSQYRNEQLGSDDRRLRTAAERIAPIPTVTFHPMTSSTASQLHPKLKFNDRDYEFNELPRTAQLLLNDLMRIDQQIGQLQFELRHLQAAKQVYGTSLRKAMDEETQHPSQADGASSEHGTEAA